MVMQRKRGVPFAVLILLQQLEDGGQERLQNRAALGNFQGVRRLRHKKAEMQTLVNFSESKQNLSIEVVPEPCGLLEGLQRG